MVEYEKFQRDRLPICSELSGHLIETSCTIMDLKGVGLRSFYQVKSYVQEASAGEFSFRITCNGRCTLIRSFASMQYPKTTTLNPFGRFLFSRLSHTSLTPDSRLFTDGQVLRDQRSVRVLYRLVPRQGLARPRNGRQDPHPRFLVPIRTPAPVPRREPTEVLGRYLRLSRRLFDE